MTEAGLPSTYWDNQIQGNIKNVALTLPGLTDHLRIRLVYLKTCKSLWVRWNFGYLLYLISNRLLAHFCQKITLDSKQNAKTHLAFTATSLTNLMQQTSHIRYPHKLRCLHSSEPNSFLASCWWFSLSHTPELFTGLAPRTNSMEILHSGNSKWLPMAGTSGVEGEIFLLMFNYSWTPKRDGWPCVCYIIILKLVNPISICGKQMEYKYKALMEYKTEMLYSYMWVLSRHDKNKWVNDWSWLVCPILVPTLGGKEERAWGLHSLQMGSQTPLHRLPR